MLAFENAVIRQQGFELRANWRIAKSERLAIIGPSGGGKSTLLSAIAGFVPLASGGISINGQDMASLAPGRRPISLLFQEHNLFPHLSTAQNVGLGLRGDLKLSRAQWGAVSDVLDRVGLNGFQARKPGELSGGQRQRVALARALLRDKPVLLLDEPFAALGPALRTGMLDLVREIADDTGATVVLVTHDPADARHIAHKTVFLDNGVALAPVDTAELFAKPPAGLADYLG